MERKERLIDMALGALFGAALTMLFFAFITGQPLWTLAAMVCTLTAIDGNMFLRWRTWGREIEQSKQQGQS